MDLQTWSRFPLRHCRCRALYPRVGVGCNLKMWWLFVLLSKCLIVCLVYMLLFRHSLNNHCQMPSAVFWKLIILCFPALWSFHFCPQWAVTSLSLLGEILKCNDCCSQGALSWSSQVLLSQCSDSLHRCLGALSDQRCNFCQRLPTVPPDISLLYCQMKCSLVRFSVDGTAFSTTASAGFCVWQVVSIVGFCFSTYHEYLYFLYPGLCHKT